ncbi:MAG: MAPEG family protein [Pseudomonadota bacterium]
MTLALVCIGLLGVLVFALGFGVSMQRRSAKMGAGVPDDPTSPLLKWSRAHGNTCEYAAMLAVLMYLLALTPQPAFVYTMMVMATFSRYLFAAGMILPATLAKPNPMRFLGALGTYLFGLGLAVMLLVSVLA